MLAQLGRDSTTEVSHGVESMEAHLAEGCLSEQAPAGARARAASAARALVCSCLALREHLQRIHTHLGIVHL